MPTAKTQPQEMTKLTKYTNFEQLKLADKPTPASDVPKDGLMLEFETFLLCLQTEFDKQKEKKPADGKQFS